MQKSNPSNF